LGLLFQTRLEGPFRDSFGSRLGHLFHRIEIDIATRPRVTKGAASKDFSPLPSEGT